MLGTAGTIGVILVPIVLIAIILAMWYCPFRRACHSEHTGATTSNASRTGVAASSTGGTTTASTPGVDNTAIPYVAPSYELQSHRSFRLARISEEGGPFHYTAAHK
ncbi:hypothetical protein F4781DRAFT_40928 [Annulohypoxylon bovei var. microspora]|nr:hypothetical protein F4781DRAFT_40928 [Annulohypoxylon bovei var. microspora]